MRLPPPPAARRVLRVMTPFMFGEANSLVRSIMRGSGHGGQWQRRMVRARAARRHKKQANCAHSDPPRPTPAHAPGGEPAALHAAAQAGEGVAGAPRRAGLRLGRAAPARGRGGAAQEGGGGVGEARGRGGGGRRGAGPRARSLAPPERPHRTSRSSRHVLRAISSIPQTLSCCLS